MLASLVAYGLTQTVFGPLSRRWLRGPMRVANPLIVLGVFGLLIAFSADARAAQGSAFWFYYGGKALVCLYLSARK